MNTQQHNEHMPVLLKQTLEVLDPKPGESYLDLTVGYGGHARAVIEKTGAAERAVLVDRDKQALASVKDLQNLGATPIHSDFAAATNSLRSSGQTFDMILADLGVSSPHLDNPARGFSFMNDGPIDMRMDQTQESSAKDLVNNLSAREFEQIIRKYGEDPRAKRIVQAIIANRPLQTTKQLADAIEDQVHRRGRTHPATRTFQALRIATNNELGQLSSFLDQVEGLLKPGSRLAIISFHSLEDRLVKTFFNERAKSGYEATLDLITKHPILGKLESVNYPRSRSAVLRAVVKK